MNQLTNTPTAHTELMFNPHNKFPVSTIPGLTLIFETDQGLSFRRSRLVWIGKFQIFLGYADNYKQSISQDCSYRRVALRLIKKWTMGVSPPTYQSKTIELEILDHFQRNTICISCYYYLNRKWVKSVNNHIKFPYNKILNFI